jgi:hypothetical protein
MCLFQASVISRGSFVFSELMWEVIIRFADIDGSVNYHLPATLQISERGSNGSYNNTDKVRWRDSVSDELWRVTKNGARNKYTTITMWHTSTFGIYLPAAVILVMTLNWSEKLADSCPRSSSPVT